MDQNRPGPEVADRRTRVPRGTLSHQVIVDAALALLDSSGDDVLTFRALGAALGASPTSVYRHFRDKSELLLAMADRLLEEAFAAIEEDPDWRVTLRSIATGMHGAYLRHPRLAVQVAARTAVGAADLQVGELILRTLERAEVPTDRQALFYRAFEDTVLAWACFDATYQSVDVEARRRDEDAWTAGFGGASAEEFPALARTRPHEVGINDSRVFETAIDLLIEAIEGRVAQAAVGR